MILCSLNCLKLCHGVVYYPRLSVAIRNTGFHRYTLLFILVFKMLTIHETFLFREVDYSIEMPKEIDCDLLIVQPFHQGTYISNDQLNDFKRLKKVEFFNCIWSIKSL